MLGFHSSFIQFDRECLDDLKRWNSKKENKFIKKKKYNS